MKKSICFLGLTLGVMSLFVQAAPNTTAANTLPTSKTAATTSSVADGAPIIKTQLSFTKLASSPGPMVLRGVSSDQQVEFGVRRDEIVSQAILHLQFTPSPALIPTDSQLIVYLNDGLMGVIPITAEQLGKSNQVQVAIEPHFISDFNRLRLSFVGHYKSPCENPVSSTLWLDVSKSSFLELTKQKLLLDNDLAHFPEPFVDPLDNQPLMLPIVFAGSPDLTTQRAAAILASWFGKQSHWRGQSFPTLFNQLPKQNAVVFATNDQRPDFLQNHPKVDAPTIEMMNHPNMPYMKLLLVMGRDNNDLVMAAKGLAQGDVLLRGSRVVIDKVEQLAPRQPYDAPYWARTDRPVTFAELQQFSDQLETSGLQPFPIKLPFNLPPDLYLDGHKGISLHLKYRYTPPSSVGTSHLNVTLDKSFVRSFALEPAQKSSGLGLFLPNNRVTSDKKTTISGFALGANNELRFDFDYMAPIIGGTENGQCETYTIVPNHANIDSNSTIDFSDYFHYIAMPNLTAFITGGFPFSRMADLSQTLVLVEKNPQPIQVTTLLNVMGNIGSQTGYPALEMRLSDDWSQAKDQNVDILMIGSLPAEFRDDQKMNLLMSAAQSWVKKPFRQDTVPSSDPHLDATQANSKITISSQGEMSAIIGVQSPYHNQRSIVALLADSPHGFELLNDALTDNQKTADIFGTAAVIRDSGINSLRVGDIYHVGHIPWWTRLWYALQSYPVLLAFAAIITALLLSIILWNKMQEISQRRLAKKKD